MVASGPGSSRIAQCSSDFHLPMEIYKKEINLRTELLGFGCVPQVHMLEMQPSSLYVNRGHLCSN